MSTSKSKQRLTQRSTHEATPGAGPDRPKSEEQTSKALRDLSGEWTVLENVPWIGRKGNKNRDGEADVVLLHAYGMIVLEVKGGGISVQNGKWFSTDRESNIHSVKDPYEQAKTSKYALLEWLKERLDFHINTGHAVVFPSLFKCPRLGPNAPPEITILGQDLGPDRIESKLRSIAKYWRKEPSLSSDKIGAIDNLLRPTVTIQRTLADRAKEAEHELIQLTEEQKFAFRGLSANRRVVIYGQAGTGKTILAEERARQFRDDGEDVLLVCYNKLLQLKWGNDKSLEGITTTNFHTLCESYMREAGIRSPANKPPDWWAAGAPEALNEALGKVARRFGAIVVDEGQDFSCKWLETLEAAGKYGTHTPFYVFADGNQKMYPRDWKRWVEDWAEFKLTANCRNTREIASRVAAIVKYQTVFPKAASGPEPRWTSLAPHGKNVLAKVTNLVERLLREDFAPTDIVVLCESNETAKQLKSASVDSELFGAFAGMGTKHGLAGLKASIKGETVIKVETINRFKGLEAQATIVVLGRCGEDPDTPAYVGFSRAKAYLHVLGPSRRKETIHW